MSMKPNGVYVCALAVSLLSGVGCDIKNPTAVSEETADPLLLIRGTRSKFSDAMGMIGSAFVASDEGLAKSAFQFEDTSGDISTAAAYTTWFSQVHQARRLSGYAITRADELGQTELGYLARVWHGWMQIRLAELFGAQPFDGGDTVSVDAMFENALADLNVATAAVIDSTRHRAYAGIARVNFVTGRSPVNQVKLHAAIDAAEKVVSANANFLWVELPNSNPLAFAMGRSYGPTPFYHDIPLWFAGFPTNAGHDATLKYADLTKPQGVVMISATELRLIQAESQLLLGDLAAAKTALKAAPLITTNHVNVCRTPTAATTSAAAIATCVDAMNAAAVQLAIESLRREDQYLSARRNVTDTGTPIMPFKLPRNA